MTHERIEEIENKFKAFSNEHINDYHGEEAWFYTKPALETAIKVNIADTLALVREEIEKYGEEKLVHPMIIGDLLRLLTPTPPSSKESGIYLKECIDKT